ncbi:MAG: hypothetical protein ACI9XP_000780 [Lentimonas sp.]|jgi:hypothetical protein
MRSIKNTISLAISLIIFNGVAIGQESLVFLSQSLFKLPKIELKRSGPYLGLQKGMYNVAEFGAEKQWTRVKLIRPVTHAARLGFNYNFKRNVIGYDLGYWFKTGRLNLTYGANLVARSDFSKTQFGIAPNIGYKFLQFHLQTGYHFFGADTNPIETNTLYISLKWVIINKRKLDIDRKKKSK